MITRPLRKAHLDQTLKAALGQLNPHRQSPAHQLFDRIPHLTQILEHSRNHRNHEAIGLFVDTHQSVKPIDESMSSCILKVCGALSDQRLGRQLHSLCVRFGLEDAVSVGTSLIDMYMKCDNVEDGRRVFDLMPERNVVTWTSLLTGYTRNGFAETVFKLFLQMRSEGVVPNPFTFASVLSSCAAERSVGIGKKVHSLLIKHEFESTTFVCNSLINMYSKCGLIREAKMVFERMENCRDVISWNAIIAGLVQNGLDLEALRFFHWMKVEGHRMTQSSFVTAVKLCANLKELNFARQLHCCLMKEGYDRDGNILTTLLVVYSKCSKVSDAFRLFSVISGDLSVVSWTAMVGGFIENGESNQAANLFIKMMRNGIEPNNFTYSTILTSDSISPSEIHCQTIKRNNVSSPSVGTALLAAYSKLGSTNEAMAVFKQINEKDIVSWSAMMDTYATIGDSEGAINLFREMAREGITPNEFTFSSAINVFASPSAASDQGKQFHALAIKSHLQDALCVSSALVTMYSKKGSIDSAEKVFERQSERDLVSWNSMVSGYAQHGYGKKALEIFHYMIDQGLELDVITFIGVIMACTHSGLVVDGKKYFDSMVTDHGISPSMEHYACMVDLYSRAGQLEEALKVIKGMPFKAGSTVWRTLLGACKVHRNLKLGELAAKTLIEIEPQDSAAYVLLSNLYAVEGKWKERDAIRKVMDERKVKKEAGISWIQIKNKVHSFLASDRKHILADRIYAKVKEMMIRLKEKGYRPNTEFVLREVEEEKKEEVLAHHSERLAIAYGLISTPPGTSLQIVKNLRVCGDCHTVIKMIAEVEGREIVVRDSNRFHHFKDGSCSCGDYW